MGKALVSWSSGKDSAFALWEVVRTGAFEIVGLLTTVTESYGRVSMHGVREEILDRQAQAAGLPCRKVRIPAGCSNADYERAMGEAVRAAVSGGVAHIVFGDLFLEDIRAYRERMLAGTGLSPVFPLWGRDTGKLAREMLAAGLAARVVCVDPKKLLASFAGRAFDAAFLADLPAGVDPCGENGEFHTCVTAGPMFTGALSTLPGKVVLRDGFVFADIVPAEAAAAV
jgi:uncharacterized protein (TIGR00290 family)